MAGRHLKVEAVKSFAGRSSVKGLTTAAVAGTFVGFASPVAFAAPEENAVQAPAATAVAATAEIGVEESAFTAPAVEIVTGENAETGWDFAAVEVEAKAAVEDVAPAVARADRRAASREARAQQAAAAEVVEDVAAVPASGRGASIAALARQFVGARYQLGGNTPAGWDCSGFVGYVYRNAGISLPRSSGAIANAGVRVSAAEAQPGDIVYWPGHVGIYTGGGMHVAAQTPALGTREARLYGNPVFIRIP